MIIATGSLSGRSLSKLRDKVDKMNKRAARLGMEEMVITILGEEAVKRIGPSGLEYTTWAHRVEVAGCAPRINGWEVIARIEFTEAGNLVHCAPGIGNLDCKYRNAGNICEHCNKNRRRNDLIVIRHSDGCEKSVGRSCLADYIRTDDAESLLAYAGFISEPVISDYDEDYRDGRAQPIESVITVIEAASICIRKLGWIPGSAAYGNDAAPTKNEVFSLLYPPKGIEDRRAWTRWIENNDLTVTDYDKDLAAKVLSWAQSLEPKQSDYLANLKVLAQTEYVKSDKFGYIVSMIPAYNKEMERETERKERTTSKGSKVFYGSPKSRERNIKAECVGIHSFSSNWGITTLIRFKHYTSDAECAVLVWFASGDKTENFEIGKDYTFDATIKDHSNHAVYGKQTNLTRVTIK